MNDPDSLFNRRFLASKAAGLLLLVCIALTGCTTLPPPSPASSATVTTYANQLTEDVLRADIALRPDVVKADAYLATIIADGSFATIGGTALLTALGTQINPTGKVYAALNTALGDMSALDLWLPAIKAGLDKALLDVPASAVPVPVAPPTVPVL